MKTLNGDRHAPNCSAMSRSVKYFHMNNTSVQPFSPHNFTHFLITNSKHNLRKLLNSIYKEHLRHCMTILSARCLCLVQILGAISFRSAQASKMKELNWAVWPKSALPFVWQPHTVHMCPPSNSKENYVMFNNEAKFVNFEINQSKSVSFLKK